MEDEDALQVKPNFNEETLHLVCGDVGPFEAGMPVALPLWLALDLRRRRKCEILVRLLLLLLRECRCPSG